jgi:emfourin
MKVTLATHGGLAAAITQRLPPWIVDTEALPKAVEEKLTQLLAAAKAASTPGKERPRRVPDEMSYTVTVEDRGHQIVLTASDTTMSQEFAALLNWIQQHSERP